MNDKQRNKLNMYDLIEDFLLASTTITSTMIVLTALFATFQDYLVQIYAVRELQERDYKGVTKTKKVLRKELTDKLVWVTRKSSGYASGVDDLDLLQLVKIPKSTFLLMADADLVKKTEDIINILKLRIADLLGYGIVMEDLETLETLKNDFKNIHTKPIGNRENTSILTKQLDSLYEETDAVLKKMDDQVGSVFDTHPEFHDEYFAKRAIVKLAKRIRALQMFVVDDETGEPMVKAIVTIRPKVKGTDLMKSVKKTGTSGGIYYNNLLAGEYDYEITFGGYVTETGSFFINDGIMTDFVVRMKKN